MHNTVKRCFLFIAILSFTLSACSFSPATPAAPTSDPNLVLTAAAQTAMARLTEAALVTPSPAPATPTLPATATLAPTATAAPTITMTLPLQPTATATLGTGVTPAASLPDRAEFVADLTVPDGTDYNPGADFTKTWRIKNNGTTTWTTGYQLVRVSSDAILGPNSIDMPKEVPPGESVDLSVDLTAPDTNGTHTSYWRLKNLNGEYFGVGVSGKDSIYVQIDVVNGAPAATSTPGGTSGDVIASLSVSFDESTYAGECPHTFNISAMFTLNKAATLTYALEAGSDVPGYEFDLPAAQTSSFPAGTQTLVFSLDLTDSGSGWVRLHVTDPEDVRSQKAEFTLTCQP